MEPVSLNVAGPARRLIAGCLLRTQPDERLVELYREGHEGAFEEIDRRYRGRLGAYAASFVGDRGEDVLQESLARAARALRADERDVQLGPWLYRIVRNASLNALRDAPPAHVQLDETIDGVEQPPDAVLRREELRETVAAVQGLPQSQREALVRREIEGESLNDIGDSMGVSSGAVGLLIFRARTALREGCGILVPTGLLRLVLGGGGGSGIAASGAGAGGVTLGKGIAAIAIGAGALGSGIAIEHATEPARSPTIASVLEQAPAAGSGSGSASSPETGSLTAAAATTNGQGGGSTAATSTREVGAAASGGGGATATVGDGTGRGRDGDSSGGYQGSPGGDDGAASPPPGSQPDDSHFVPGDHEPGDGFHHEDGGGDFHQGGFGGDDDGAPPPPSGYQYTQPPPDSDDSYEPTQQLPPPPDGGTLTERSTDDSWSSREPQLDGEISPQP